MQQDPGWPVRGGRAHLVSKTKVRVRGAETGKGKQRGDVEDGLTSEREREAKLGRTWVGEKARSGRLWEGGVEMRRREGWEC